ncbi:MAG: hypothetical protein MJE77_46970 [Proteobacteria bacterium]|nr:hypothetical protein [Pseudomonadota bacterium]
MIVNELRVGNVIGRSFSVWFNNFVPFFILTTLVYSPLIIYTVVALEGDLSPSGLQTYSWVSSVGQFVLNFLATAALIYGVLQQLRGRHASIGDCIGVGLKRLVPVILVGITAWLCIGLGTLLLIIPGILLSLMFYVAVPAAVVERRGIIGSLQRSHELTTGHKGTIFATWLVILLGAFGLSILVGLVVSSSIESISDLKYTVYLNLVTSILWGSFSAVVSAIIYHDLRNIKDGVDVEELVRVFE